MENFIVNVIVSLNLFALTAYLIYEFFQMFNFEQIKIFNKKKITRKPHLYLVKK